MAECCAKPSVIFQGRMVLYSLLIFFSFFIFVGIVVMKKESTVGDTRGGACPLNMEYEGLRLVGGEAACNFPTFTAVTLQLLFLLFRLLTVLCQHLGKMSKENHYCLFNGCMELVYVCLEALAALFTFIGAIVLTGGRAATCEAAREHRVQWNCDWTDWTSAAMAAEAGAWISVFLWLGVVVLDMATLYRSGSVCRRPQGAEAVAQSEPDLHAAQDQAYVSNPHYSGQPAPVAV